MNSKHTLYNSIVKYSHYNASTVIGENIRYLMSKYGIYEHEWYLPICIIQWRSEGGHLPPGGGGAPTSCQLIY